MVEVTTNSERRKKKVNCANSEITDLIKITTEIERKTAMEIYVS